MSDARVSARPPEMQRIAVVGTTGSGKTSLAKHIAETLGLLHVELDSLHWGPDWAPVPLQAFRENTSTALSGRTWVVDGNYSKVRDIVWRRAGTLVWLDYPLGIVLPRLAWRTLKRIITREELWGVNRESLWIQLFTRDSLFVYAFNSHCRRRREYPRLLERPEHAHIRMVRFDRPHAAREWLHGLAQ